MYSALLDVALVSERLRSGHREDAGVGWGVSRERALVVLASNTFALRLLSILDLAHPGKRGSRSGTGSRPQNWQLAHLCEDQT
jgi:hypothetical protein